MSAPDFACTVVVCTRNRAESLRRTLVSLLRQESAPGELEVLVVDNGSTDHTEAVVAECANGATLPVRYVLEPEPGLSRARNRGVELARSPVVAFLDDDATPRETSWARNLVDAYRDPRVGAAGGDLVAVWPEGGRPPWLHDQLLPSLGLTLFRHDAPAQTHYPAYPWGANLSYRRQRVLDAGGFSLDLGRVGSQPLSGEETELCLRLEQAGEKILYVPEAVVDHDMSGKDITPEAIQRYARFQGVSEARIERRNFSRARLARMVLRRLRMLAIGAVGSVVFSARRSPRSWLLCRFRLRSSWAYLETLLRPRLLSEDVRGE